MERCSSRHEGIAGWPHPDQRLLDNTTWRFLGQSPAQSASAIRQKSVPGGDSPPRPCERCERAPGAEPADLHVPSTGRPLTPETASLDHMVRLGCATASMRWKTPRCCTRNINRAKTTMTNNDFIQLCCEVVEYTKLTGTKYRLIINPFFERKTS